MKKCKVHDLPGVDLTKYTTMFSGKELLKQIYINHSQELSSLGIKLNIEIKKVNGQEPCPECGGSDFMRTGVCHVCVQCGTSQGCS